MAPKTNPRKVSSELEEQVIAAPKALQQKRIAQTEAIAISSELRRQGIEPPPACTVNRIISLKPV